MARGCKIHRITVPQVTGSHIEGALRRIAAASSARMWLRPSTPAKRPPHLLWRQFPLLYAGGRAFCCCVSPG